MTLLNLWYLHRIVNIRFRIRPAASIRTNHVASMSQNIKGKGVSFWLHNIFVAHPNSQPIHRSLFDLKCHFLDSPISLDVRFHNGKLVCRAASGFDNSLADDIDFSMLCLCGKLEFRTRPNIEIGDTLRNTLNVSLDFQVDFFYHFSEQGCDFVVLIVKRVYDVWFLKLLARLVSFGNQRNDFLDDFELTTLSFGLPDLLEKLLSVISRLGTF